MVLTITPFYAGLLALWFLVLSLRVVAGRFKGPGLGDGGDPGMLRVIRGHANFAEYVPLILLLLAMLEMGGTTAPWLLHTLGAALLAGRLLHGFALSFSEQFVFGRSAGILLTFLALALAGALCAWRGIAVLLLAPAP